VQNTSSAAPQLWTPYFANQGIVWSPNTPTATFQVSPSALQPYLGLHQWNVPAFQQPISPVVNQPAPRNDEEKKQK
jgi:hypothetical protein